MLDTDAAAGRIHQMGLRLGTNPFACASIRLTMHAMNSFAARLALLALAGSLMTHGAESPAADEPTGPHAREIRQLRDRAGWRQKTGQSFLADFQEFGDFTKSDLLLVAAEFQAFAAAFQKAIDAYPKGDVEAARALTKEADKTKESRDWRKRLLARREQAEAWPSEKWAEEMQTKWGGARTHAFGAEWVASRRRASSAWGRYAESIAPGVEHEKQLALEDAAHLAEAEVRATEERWRIRQTLDDRLWDKTVTSPELEAKIREFEKFGDKTLEIMRQRAEGDRLWREWQRERVQAERELEETFRAIREQQESLKRAKPVK
jgi:hypothetical protein